MKTISALLLSTFLAAASDVRVVVWDEQQPRQKQAYENFLGNAIADYLKTRPGLKVRSVKQNDPNKGIGADVLDNCDVLIWWGHVRQAKITPADCKPIIDRIKAGKLSFIPLHSAHWATPFMEAMNERTRMDAAKRFPRTRDSGKVVFNFIPPEGRVPPDYNSQTTPFYYALRRRGVLTKVRVDLPNCCFPGYRGDGKPSRMDTLLPAHPIAKGLPKTWTIAKTEMYDEPFHVPEPDAVIFKESFAGGEWFRSGALWNLGKGKVFYFRPGHETYPVFKEKFPLLVIENAVRWLAAELKAGDKILYRATPLTEKKSFTPGIEGPACDAYGNIYAVNFAKQQTIGRTTPAGKSEVFVTLPGKSVGNGIRFGPRGGMFVADYVWHNVLRIDPRTKKVSVFAHEPKMNQPNDLAIAPDGTLFASDPNWSAKTGQLWSISPKGKVTRLAENMGTTNGVEVSPDGKKLYINESVQRNVWAFDILPGGNIANKKLLKKFPDHGFDGMRCDAKGNLYITRYGKGTVVILSPEGKILREINVLGARPSNLAFGGPDGRTVYVTEVEHQRLVQFRVEKPGAAWMRWRKPR